MISRQSFYKMAFYAACLSGIFLLIFQWTNLVNPSSVGRIDFSADSYTFSQAGDYESRALSGNSDKISTLDSSDFALEFICLANESSRAGNILNNERGGGGNSYSHDKKSKLLKLFNKYTVHREALICLFLLLAMLPTIGRYSFVVLNLFSNWVYQRPAPVRAGPAVA